MHKLLSIFLFGTMLMAAMPALADDPIKYTPSWSVQTETKASPQNKVKIVSAPVQTKTDVPTPQPPNTHPSGPATRPLPKSAAPTQAQPVQTPPALPDDPGYIIGAGDMLFVSVWKDEALTSEVVVLPDGTISFPLVGSLPAAGKTVAELKKDMEERIKRYVPNPVLTVSVRSVNSMFIYIIGKVNSPGRFILNSNVTVLQALSMAGGLNPFAENNNIKIMRSEDGKSLVLKFRYNDVMKGKHLEQNVVLKRGDVIVVP